MKFSFIDKHRGIWTAEGWLYVAAVANLFSRRVVNWLMSAAMIAQFVTDALVMAIWRRGKPDALVHHSDRGSQGGFNRLSQHGLSQRITARGQAPRRVFSSLGSCGVVS